MLSYPFYSISNCITVFESIRKWSDAVTELIIFFSQILDLDVFLVKLIILQKN